MANNYGSKIDIKYKNVRFQDALTRESQWTAICRPLDNSGAWRNVGDATGLSIEELDDIERKTMTSSPTKVLLQKWQQRQDATVFNFLNIMQDLDYYTIKTYVERAADTWIDEHKGKTEASFLNLKISVTSSAIQEILEGQVVPCVDVAPYADQVTEDLSIGYHIERSPFTVTMSPNSVTASTIVRYKVMGKLQFRKQIKVGFINQTVELPPVFLSCGHDEPLREMTIGLNFNIDIDANWNLVLDISPIVNSISRCEVSLFRFDVTDHIANIVHRKLSEAIPGLRQKIIELVNLRANAQQAWGDVSKSHCLGEDWINFHPFKFLWAKNANSNALTATLKIECRPEVTKDQPPEQPVSDLPPLTITNNLISDKFAFCLPLSIPNSMIKEQIMAKFSGFKFPSHGPIQFVLLNVHKLEGHSSLTLGLQVGIHNTDIKMELELESLPYYDEATKELTFTDLQATNFDPPRGTHWDPQEVFKQLETKLKLNLKNEIDEMKAKMNMHLNLVKTGKGKLVSQVEEISIRDVETVGADRMQAIVTIKGNVQIII